MDGTARSGTGQRKSEVFDSGRKTIVDCAHVKVERLETYPVLFSKVFKEFEDWKGQKYDYRYWAERENFFLREFLKKQNEFTHVVQARHLISENEAAKQVLTSMGITIANWLRVKTRYIDSDLEPSVPALGRVSALASSPPGGAEASTIIASFTAISRKTISAFPMHRIRFRRRRKIRPLS